MVTLRSSPLEHRLPDISRLIRYWRLCLAAEQRPGARAPKRWREQGGLDWEGAREAARAVDAATTETEEAEEDREEDNHND